MYWYLVSSHTKKPIVETQFASRGEAEEVLARMGAEFSRLCEVRIDCDDPKAMRMLNEGLARGDLREILLPKISIDEYVPVDPDTDNVVLAFFVKGVPEAVPPLYNFCQKSNGVIYADYGDSDTVPNASIVYAEFDRHNLKYQNVLDLIYQIGLLADVKVEDFQISFPNSNRLYPYDTEVIDRYFKERDRQENLAAQQQALQDRTTQLQADIDAEMSGKTGRELAQTESTQSMVERLIEAVE